MPSFSENRPDLAKRHGTYVYFARATPSGLIKIGYSSKPSSRAGGLKLEAREAVRVLFTIPGGAAKEKSYHRKFREYRYHGEWFHEAGKLHEFLFNRGHGGTRTVIEKQVKILPGPAKLIEVLKPVFVEKIALSAGPRPQLVGYARVSTEDQNLDLQISALRDAGIEDENLYVEKISAVNAKRPMFHAMLKYIEGGDTLIVHSLSRLGRDVQQIHSILNGLEREGVAWRSITEPHLNNATATGRLMLNITGAMAQFERDQIKDRTKRGMDECRRKGMNLGRAKKFTDAQAALIKKDRKTMTAKECADKWECSVGTIDKYTRQPRVKKAA